MIIHKGMIGETYCIGGSSEIKNIDLARLILKHFKLGDEMIEYVSDRKGHDFRYAINSTKIKKELGWKPRHNFKAGLKKTINWYKKNQDWWFPLKKRVIKNITR